jgi:hypothetical protein
LYFCCVEEWINNAGGLVTVTEHFKNILLFLNILLINLVDLFENIFISIKFEVKIKIIVKLEWMEFWYRIVNWIEPKLIWIKVEVSKGGALLLHDVKLLVNSLSSNIHCKVSGNQKANTCKCNYSARILLDYEFKPPHFLCFSFSHLNSVCLSNFSSSILSKDWSENCFGLSSLFEDQNSYDC